MSDGMMSGFSDVDSNDVTEPVERPEPVEREEKADSEAKPEGKTERTFTADEVNELIEKRLKREKRAAEEEKRKASMTAAERARAEKVEAEQAAAERMDQANTRVVRSEAKLQALEAGVRPERAKAVLELARGELANVEVDEFGDPNADAIKAAIAAVIKEYPEFTSEGTKPSWGKAPDASRNTGQPVDPNNPEAVRANFLQGLLGSRM